MPVSRSFFNLLTRHFYIRTDKCLELYRGRMFKEGLSLTLLSDYVCQN